MGSLKTELDCVRDANVCVCLCAKQSMCVFVRASMCAHVCTYNVSVCTHICTCFFGLYMPMCMSLTREREAECVSLCGILK